jgi:rhomboid protease GluP
VPVGEYANLGHAQEHALVISAMNLSCWLGRGESGYVLLAEPGSEQPIAAELRAYDQEQLESQPRPVIQLPHYHHGGWLALLWATLVMAVFILQGQWAWVEDLGKASSHGLFERGEWWRPLTALFLHADLAHLGMNLAFGVTYAVLACGALGRWLAWSLIIASGIIGNILTAASYYPDEHLSLGASTLVFGALGILTGYGFYVAFRAPESGPWKTVLVPIGGGLAMLGFFGAGGGNTDIIAHLFGFLSGAVLGTAASWWRLRPFLGRA